MNRDKYMKYDTKHIDTIHETYHDKLYYSYQSFMQGPTVMI